MSAAHTCFRRTLSQVFRSPSRGGTAACYTVPAFLVPALSRPARRSFSSGKRRTRRQQPTWHAQTPHPLDAGYHEPLRKPQSPPIFSRIPFPAKDARGDIEAWVAAIEPYLPAHLRSGHTNDPDVSATVTSLDLACVLDTAHKSSLDIISHVGLSLGRWGVVTWMCRKLLEDGRRSIGPPAWLGPSENSIFSKHETRTLQEISEIPIRVERISSPSKSTYTLAGMASAPDSIDACHTLVKRGLGHLWRSLGNLILIASERLHERADQIMPHVLEVIAHLHHMGFIPDSIYKYQPTKDKHVLRQPPTISTLSAQILTALSDASWRAHVASHKASKDGSKASKFLGYEISESRVKVRVSELTPELWLELVLWSCLHGGWILPGMEILRKLARRRGHRRWSLISWREILEAEEKDRMGMSRWQSFISKGDTSAIPKDREKIQRTISVEVVAAFVDGLVSQMRVGVGTRGLSPEELIPSLKLLKNLLDKNNLSLGFATWDAIMLRLLETGGLEPEKRPDILLSICELASGFGAEISTANIPPVVDAEVPYFFEPTTMTLSLLHRAIRAFIAIGDIKSAVTTLDLLQRHTDGNKQQSITEFFASMKTLPLPERNEPFTSRIPTVEFPSFDTQLPITLLAKVLDLATESQWFDLARWMLFSNDVDGPLISPDFHSHRNIAASIIRFGTMVGENDTVLATIKKVQTWNPNAQQQRMPAEVLIALLCCQLKLRKWESARGMQEYMLAAQTFRPRVVILSTFAAELIRSSQDSSEEKLEAQEAFRDLLFSWESLLGNIRNELYCILGIMSSVDVEWKEYCSQFLSISVRQPIKLSTGDFNRLLGGVLDAYGSIRGRVLVDQWCHIQPDALKHFQAPGGLLTMPRFRVSAREKYDHRPGDIEFEHESGSRLVLQGRILPNRQTIWAILRKVQTEVAQAKRRSGELPSSIQAEVRDTLSWAMRMLYYLGHEYEDTLRNLGSLAELVRPEAAATLPDSKGLDVQVLKQLNQ